jgi:hypothetical protein
MELNDADQMCEVPKQKDLINLEVFQIKIVETPNTLIFFQ